VMSKPVIATPAQILRIRQRIGGSNARPVQPLNGRVLSYAVE
jgi:carbonic anhydrase